MGGIYTVRSRWAAFVVLTAAFWLPALLVLADPTNSPPAEKADANDSDTFWAQHVVQSYQQLQQQQESMMREMEQARQNAEAAAKRDKEEMEARLARIEQSVSAEREREIAAMQSSHRMTLIIVSVFAGVGFFGMLFLAVFLLRIMNRRTETLVAQFSGQPLGAGFAPAALGSGDTQLVGMNRMEQSTARFLNTIERLEKRIHELEGAGESDKPTGPVATAKTPESLPESRPPQPAEAAEAESPAARAKSEKTERDARIALLLGKGQALLNLQQADTALACFEEVIGLDSTNPEAFVKKGMALERLGKLDEAIDCYDRAIALDNSLTMAYLSKGGVFNRLERYGEALQCYEQALRAQQKPSLA